MNDDEEARDDDNVAVELIRPSSTFGSFPSGISTATSSKKCNDAKVLSRATSQATLAARTILAAGGSEDTALRTAQAAAQSTLLESHIGISAFSNSKGGPSAYVKRRQIKRQSEVVAAMALMSATNQVYNETDRELLYGEDSSPLLSFRSMSVGPSKTAKPAPLQPRPGAPRKKSLTTIIQEQEVASANSKVSIDSANTETYLLPSATEKPKSKSRSIELDQDMGSAENAVSQSLETTVVSQASGKDSGAVESHHFEGVQSSSGYDRPRQTIVRPPSTLSQPRSVKINVVQAQGTNANRHYRTVDEPIYFVNHGATEAGGKGSNDMNSVDSSTVVSEGDSHMDTDDSNSLYSNYSLMEDDMEPCFSFWRCGAGEETKFETKVETPEAPAVTKKKLPSSRIEPLRIVLPAYSDDSETVDRADQDKLESPYEVALSDKQKKFRAKLRAAARKREKALPAKPEREQAEEPEVRDDVECERERSENDDDKSSQSSPWHAGDLSFESHASSFSKSNDKGRRSWKKLLGIKKKQVQIE